MMLGTTQYFQLRAIIRRHEGRVMD